MNTILQLNNGSYVTAAKEMFFLTFANLSHGDENLQSAKTMSLVTCSREKLNFGPVTVVHQSVRSHKSFR